MKFLHVVYLIPFLTTACCRLYSVENPDGSYSTGLNSDSRGETALSLAALLAKSAGYTFNNDDDFETSQQEAEDYQSNASQQEAEHYQSNPSIDEDTESRNLLSPHMEILQLIEVFLQFKAELASRLQAVVSDNWEIIRSVYMTVVSKLGTLHSFTVTGIKILRKVLQLAVNLMAQWQINLPGVSLDLSLGDQNTDQGSFFSFNKNGNFFSGK